MNGENILKNAREMFLKQRFTIQNGAVQGGACLGGGLYVEGGGGDMLLGLASWGSEHDYGY